MSSCITIMYFLSRINKYLFGRTINSKTITVKDKKVKKGKKVKGEN